MYAIDLPDGTNEKELIEALDILISPALTRRNIEYVGWSIISAYSQGCRYFNVTDMERGKVEISYEDEDGRLHLRWDEPMTRLHTEIGRLSKLDVSPVARKRRFSLESMRNSSLSQALLSHMNSPEQEEILKTQLITGVCMYGTYAHASWVDMHEDNPTAHMRELIPPWELLPIPAETSNPTDLRGIIRTRLMPLSDVRKMEGVSLKDVTDEELEIVEVSYGTTLSSLYPNNLAEHGMTGGGIGDLYDKERTSTLNRNRKKQDISNVSVKCVKLREFYSLVGTPAGQAVHRYIVRAGRAIVSDKKYWKDGVKVPFPIGITRYQDTGHFYGRGLMHKILPFALELERLLERLIEHSADMDRLWFIALPTNMGFNVQDLTPTGYPKVITYEPDLSGANSRIENIQPPTANDLPARLMQFGVSLLDRMTAQGPLYSGEAPGRGDSGTFIASLADMGATHLYPVGLQLESSYATVFRAQLYGVKKRFESGSVADNTIDVTRFENSIAGISLDPTTGRLILDAASIPDPWSIELGIRSRDPQEFERRRQEAIAALQMQVLSKLEFIILNYKEGWNFPLGNRSVWEQYVKAVFQNLVLFNDGQTPGQFPVEGGGPPFLTNIDKAEVHLLAIEDFTSGPEFALASAEVITAFNNRVMFIKSRGLGISLPPQAPQITDIATPRNGRVQQQPQQ